VAFGAMAIFGKVAYAQGIPLDSLLFLRFAIAGAVVAGWMLITQAKVACRITLQKRI
jgi:hypothetical protein